MFFPQTHIDCCLRGFTQILPPKEEWDKFTAFDTDNEFFHPLPMFDCNGTINSISIPYSTIEGISWDNYLELTVDVWQQQSTGGYVQRSRSISLKVRTTSATSTTENIKGFATAKAALQVTTKDTLVLRNRQIGRHRREHIPFLLTEYQPPGCTQKVTVPMVSIDFIERSSHTPDAESVIMGKATQAANCTQMQNVAENQTGKSESQTLPLGAALTLAILLTQVEATALSVVVTILVMYCCCMPAVVKKIAAQDTQHDTTGSLYEEVIDQSRYRASNGANGVIMQRSPAYGLPQNGSKEGNTLHI
jgi:hypothetical protein